MRDSQHLTSEDLDNNLLTELPIQKIFYFSTGIKDKAKQVFSNSGLSFFSYLFCLDKLLNCPQLKTLGIAYLIEPPFIMR